MSTAFVVVPSADHHRSDHPENPDRIATVMELLEQEDVLPELSHLSPVPAAVEQLRAVHSTAMIEMIRDASAQGLRNLDADTYVTPASYEAALLAAGSCTAVVDQILSGRQRNGLALVRPPGHHAESERPGGFCLFNNAAVAARHAQVAGDIQRVLIIDFDVHHGNGTQEIFYQDGSVLFISVHLHSRFFYPGTGSLPEIGSGPGQGLTLNVPLPPRVGDVGYDQIFDELIQPKAAAFGPELIIISAGFDAHWRDPLAYSGLTLTGYAALNRKLVQLAADLCDERILFILEGGYLRQALAYGVLNLTYVLLGQDLIQDPLGPLPHPEASVTNLLSQLKQLHLIN